jgi:hypothetical protein
MVVEALDRGTDISQGAVPHCREDYIGAKFPR